MRRNYRAVIIAVSVLVLILLSCGEVCKDADGNPCPTDEHLEHNKSAADAQREGLSTNTPVPPGTPAPTVEWKPLSEHAKDGT